KRTLQITRFPVRGSRGSVRLTISAERGEAEIRLPNRLGWCVGNNRHLHSYRAKKPVSEVLLERFYTAIREGHSLKPDLADAYRVLNWLRTARRSREEGRWIELAPR